MTDKLTVGAGANDKSFMKGTYVLHLLVSDARTRTRATARALVDSWSTATPTNRAFLSLNALLTLCPYQEKRSNQRGYKPMDYMTDTPPVSKRYGFNQSSCRGSNLEAVVVVPY